MNLSANLPLSPLRIMNLSANLPLSPLRIMNLSANLPLSPLRISFDSPGDFVLFVFNILAGTSTVLVAGSVACGIVSARPLLRQNRFIFMLNTSISDTMSGCGIFCEFFFAVEVGFASKNGTYYIVPSLLGVNMLTFLFAQFDRYFAVCQPFLYGRCVTTSVIVCVNAFCWFYVYCILCVQHLLPLSKALEITIYGRIAVQVIIVAKVAMTMKLLLVAKFQLNREPPSAERDRKRESLVIIILVVVAFLLLWSPVIFYTIVSRLTGRRFAIKSNASNPLRLLARSNTLCTPTLYLWASPSLRAAVCKNVWGKFCCFKRTKKMVGMISAGV